MTAYVADRIGLDEITVHIPGTGVLVLTLDEAERLYEELGDAIARSCQACARQGWACHECHGEGWI